MRKIKISILFLVLGVFAACSTNQSGSHSSMGNTDSELKLDVKKYTLSNGLRLLVLENNQLPIYSYHTFFDVGGRYEEAGTTGATHVLEHMMCKGGHKYVAGSFDTFIESNGGSTNAYTTFDSTVYHQNMPTHTLERMIDLEADRLTGILLEEVDFEKGVPKGVLFSSS